CALPICLRARASPTRDSSAGLATRAARAGWTCPREGDENAQAEDQERRQEALQAHGERQDQARRGRQAPPPDQPQRQVHPPEPWHLRPVRSGHQDGQEVGPVRARLSASGSRAGDWRAMSRIKRGTTTRQKHKRILGQAKGYRGRRKNTIRVARQAVEKAGQYAYRDRK